MFPEKTYLYVKIKSIKNVKKECYLGSGCSICYKDILGDNKIRLLHCNHIFHSECIDEWLTKNPTCPVCKHNYRTGV